MGLRSKASLIIYRYAEKGLEVFLESTSDDTKNDNLWKFPESDLEQSPITTTEDRLIELDPVASDNGNVEKAWAVEGEWHDIPTFCNMMVSDIKEVKDKIATKVTQKPTGGTFVNLKEAFKKLLPHHYEMLKELKDILSDRNSIKNI